VPDPDVPAGTGTLYLVPTPIGNPRDITLRAVDVLGRVAVIACEDTRHARTLLRQLEIGAERLLSYHDHNEEARSRQLLATLRDGEDVALISDAGTPLVNDPGYRLVASAIAEGVPVVPLPGASATITALIGSGLPNDRFLYAGFLPRKSAARRAVLGELRGVAATLIFFEAPHRIVETLDDMRAVLGDRPVALGRNLTKSGEEFLRGPISAVADRLRAEQTVRGEFTVVVGGGAQAAAEDEHALAERLIDTMARHGADRRLIREVLREVTDLPRNWVYDRVQAVDTPTARPS
jgi:16S rRNA (cytidine1402-2'-O)-methyltransferase